MYLEHKIIVKGHMHFCQYRKELILLSQKQAILPNQLFVSLSHTHYRFTNYLVTISAQASFLTGVAWGTYC